MDVVRSAEPEAGGRRAPVLAEPADGFDDDVDAAVAAVALTGPGVEVLPVPALVLMDEQDLSRWPRARLAVQPLQHAGIGRRGQRRRWQLVAKGCTDVFHR